MGCLNRKGLQFSAMAMALNVQMLIGHSALPPRRPASWISRLESAHRRTTMAMVNHSSGRVSMTTFPIWVLGWGENCRKTLKPLITSGGLNPHIKICRSVTRGETSQGNSQL